ncbi:hypothetical protein VV02_23065 [Luteipulveratus mongoliensis]|uniref:Uncharacterized protein n=1 Tax=Luteipulveratus mongoliensis TaxID=571913 RepID=A0A0K1JNA8_9MICO|nr:hypothetical protein VV02_23065 [Luteipulveratus mongoliensis]
MVIARSPELSESLAGRTRGVLVATRGAAAPLEEWLRSASEGLVEQNPTFHLLQAADVELDGQPGFRILGTQVAPGGAAVVLDQINTIVPGEDTETAGIALSFTWPALVYDAACAAQTEDMAASLQFGGVS